MCVCVCVRAMVACQADGKLEREGGLMAQLCLLLDDANNWVHGLAAQ